MPAVITYHLGELYLNGQRVIWPRDSGFQNASVLFGLDYVNSAFVPIATDPTGQLSTSAVVASTNFFYRDGSAGAITDAAYVEVDFGFSSKAVIVQNDETVAGNNLLISWDGINLANTFMPGETKQFDGFSATKIYLKAAPTKTITSYRITAW